MHSVLRTYFNLVMVYDASLNPCCCKVLCTPNEDKDGITCIAQVFKFICRLFKSDAVIFTYISF